MNVLNIFVLTDVLVCLFLNPDNQAKHVIVMVDCSFFRIDLVMRTTFFKQLKKVYVWDMIQIYKISTTNFK